VCWDGAQFDTKQHYGKAYPGRRQLEVLEGIGEQAIVASICPSNLADPNAADYGYRPAMGAIRERLPWMSVSDCWDLELSPGADGVVDCEILEVTRGERSPDGTHVDCPPCEGVRQAPSPSMMAIARNNDVLKENGMSCACEIPQLQPGAGLETCLQEPDAGELQGWCYLDGNESLVNQDLIGPCPVGSQQRVRFVGEGIPADNVLMLMACRAASICP